MQKYQNVFIGITLPAQDQEDYKELLEKLSNVSGNVKTVDVETAHITLYFLGSRNEEEILKIKQKIDKYVNILKGSRVKIKSLGNFGNKNRRVIFLKVYHDSVLEKFYEKIKSELDSYREESRKFKPHLTLGRIRKNHFYKNIKPKLIDVIKETEYDFEIKNIDIYGRKNMREPQKILHTTPVMNA